MNMQNLSTPSSLLIIEPNRLIAKPYTYFPDSYNITRVTTLETAFEQLMASPPALVSLSTSYSINKMLDFLTELQHFTKDRITPLIYVVDFDHRLNFIPGTWWGCKVSILTPLSTEEEVRLTFRRIDLG